MIDIRHQNRLLSRIAAALRMILSSAGGDAIHGIHYGCDLPPPSPTPDSRTRNGGDTLPMSVANQATSKMCQAQSGA